MQPAPPITRPQTRWHTASETYLWLSHKPPRLPTTATYHSADTWTDWIHTAANVLSAQSPGITTRKTWPQHCGWHSKTPSTVWMAARRRRLDASWALLLYSLSLACPRGGLTPRLSSWMTTNLLALSGTRMRTHMTRSQSLFAGPSFSSLQTDRLPHFTGSRHRCCAIPGTTTNSTTHVQQLRVCWAV